MSVDGRSTKYHQKNSLNTILGAHYLEELTKTQIVQTRILNRAPLKWRSSSLLQTRSNLSLQTKTKPSETSLQELALNKPSSIQKQGSSILANKTQAFDQRYTFLKQIPNIKPVLTGSKTVILPEQYQTIQKKAKLLKKQAEMFIEEGPLPEKAPIVVQASSFERTHAEVSKVYGDRRKRTPLSNTLHKQQILQFSPHEESRPHSETAGVRLSPVNRKYLQIPNIEKSTSQTKYSFKVLTEQGKIVTAAPNRTRSIPRNKKLREADSLDFETPKSAEFNNLDTMPGIRRLSPDIASVGCSGNLQKKRFYLHASVSKQSRSMSRSASKDWSPPLQMLDTDNHTHQDEILIAGGTVHPSGSRKNMLLSLVKKQQRQTTDQTETSELPRSLQEKGCVSALQLTEESISRAKKFIEVMDQTGKDFPLSKEERRNEVRSIISRGVKLIWKLLSNGFTAHDVESTHNVVPH